MTRSVTSERPQPNADDRRRGWALAALGMLLVSTDSVFVRLAETVPWDFVFFTSLCSLLVQLLLANRFEPGGIRSTLRALAPSDRRAMWIIAGLSGISQVSFVTALTETKVANVVVIVAATPLFAAGTSRILLGERTSKRTWTAIVVSFAGIVLVVAGSLGEPNLKGDLLALLAVLSFSTNISLWRRNPSLSRFLTLALSAAIAVAAATPFIDLGNQGPRFYLAGAAMGLVFNPLGRLAYTNAPRFAPTSEVALFTPVETIAATTWAWLLFSEQPPLNTVAGAILIIAALLYATTASGSR